MHGDIPVEPPTEQQTEQVPNNTEANKSHKLDELLQITHTSRDLYQFGTQQKGDASKVIYVDLKIKESPDNSPVNNTKTRFSGVTLHEKF